MQKIIIKHISSLFAILLGVLSVAFLVHKIDILSDWRFLTQVRIFYALFFIIILADITWSWRHNNKLVIKIKSFLFTLLPSVLIFTFAINTQEVLISTIFSITTGFYFVFYGALLIYQYHKKYKCYPIIKHSKKILPKKQQIITITLLTVTIAIHLFFGIHNIGKASYVDERLWVYDRIEQYWDNLSQRDFKNTRPSDKPGVTTAIMSGPSLLFFDPSDFNKGQEHKLSIERLFSSLRLFPFLIITFLIIFSFWIIKKLLGISTALITTIFLSFSPLLLGISRIINPDASLWIFFFISMLSFFLYLRETSLRYLYFASIFLGCALLTKYTANILFIFYFILIFVDIALHKNLIDDINIYIKNKLTHYGILIFIAFSIIYIFYPGTWVKHNRLLLATIHSEAFTSTWIYFFIIIMLVFLDTFYFKNVVLNKLLSFLYKYKKGFINFIVGIFTMSTLLVIYNVYTNMSLFDFMHIIESPKSIYREINTFTLYISAFYPLIYGITPLVFIAFIFTLLRIFTLKKLTIAHTVVFYSIIFILFYYIGSIVTHVMPIVRYQIILYPLIILIAGIGFADLINLFPQKTKLIPTVATLLILISTIQLSVLTNFYFSYNSPLLPAQFVINTKDMGDGTYEIAQYLNALPDAKNLLIWTDKRSICQFFIGKCNNMIKDPQLATIAPSIDYYIVSQNRKNHIIQLTKQISHYSKYNLRLDRLYDKNVPIKYKFYPTNRESQYIYIIRGEDISIINN